MDNQARNEMLFSQQRVLNLAEPEDQTPWVALQLFSMNQYAIAQELKEKHYEVYVPLEWVMTEKTPGHRKRELRPVVRNLLFLKARDADSELAKMVAELAYPVRLMRKSRETRELAKIPARQMYEFQVMCNPDFLQKRILTSDAAKLKKGQLVSVTHGPLKGLRGRLVRANKKYFLLKEIPGVAVMMNVSRWCCEPLAEE